MNTAHTITRISDYLDRIARVTDAGGTTTRKHQDAVKRWRTWAGHDNTGALTQLEDAYASGQDTQTLEILRQAALISETLTPVHYATVRNAVAPAALDQVTSTYQPSAIGNYETIREQFNNTAATFHENADIIDPETNADQLVAADDTTRRAWLDADLAAHQLTQLASVLADAATLAGHPITTDADAIGLTINAHDAHRRHIWDAWNNTGRTGKWGPVAALGATIEAPALDDLTAYREPRPMETIYRQSDWGMKAITIDPEDPDYEEQAAKPGRVTIL